MQLWLKSVILTGTLPVRRLNLSHTKFLRIYLNFDHLLRLSAILYRSDDGVQCKKQLLKGLTVIVQSLNVDFNSCYSVSIVCQTIFFKEYQIDHDNQNSIYQVLLCTGLYCLGNTTLESALSDNIFVRL